jgi:hypothetical protein
MKKLMLITALVAFAATSCFMGTIEGSGTVVSEDREASGFRGVELSNMGRVVLQRGDVEGVTVRADDNIIPHLVTELRGDVLHIGMTASASGKIIRPTEPVVFTVTFRELSSISVSGSGSIDVAHLEAPFLELSLSGSGGVVIGDLEAGQVRSSLTGSGMLSLTGTADAQTLDMSGSGGYYAQKLATRDARVTLSGSGMIIVDASETLSVNISGSGLVRYAGRPEISSSITGSGRLEPVQQVPMPSGSE